MTLKKQHLSLQLFCLDTGKSVLEKPNPSKITLESLKRSKLANCINDFKFTPHVTTLPTLPEVNPNKPILISFTSGTSKASVPKAVSCTHENVLFMTSTPPSIDRPQVIYPSSSWSWISAHVALLSVVTQGLELERS